MASLTESSSLPNSSASQSGSRAAMGYAADGAIFVGGSLASFSLTVTPGAYASTVGNLIILDTHNALLGLTLGASIILQIAACRRKSDPIPPNIRMPPVFMQRNDNLSTTSRIACRVAGGIVSLAFAAACGVVAAKILAPETLPTPVPVASNAYQIPTPE